ncbi:MAG: hypothetical protein ACE5KS_06340 [Woeseiaceae bacterium]
MTDSKGKDEMHDASVGVIDALDQLDVKALSYIQLRRLYATAMDAVEALEQEIELRKDDDSAGDTVRVPAQSTS